MPAQPNCQARGTDKTTTLIRNQLQNDYSPLISSVPRSVTVGKPWKKCSSEQKEKFINNVMEFLTKLFVGGDRTEFFHENGAYSKLPSLEEKVAKWKFLDMDRNRNGVRRNNFCHGFQTNINHSKLQMYIK